MKLIDIKSLLIGILGTALVMVLMGLSSMQKQYDVECITLPTKGDTIQCRRFILNDGRWESLNNFPMFNWGSFMNAKGF